MKFVLAPDSFKESMTALQVANSMERGLRRIFPDCEIVKVPMADGGEGTVQSLVDATGGKIIKVEVMGPLQTRVQAEFGLLGDGQTAVIEMASASGITHTSLKNRNPLFTTTYGTGELITHALELGVQKIIIGLGGSATNDGGQGMACALGVKFTDSNGDAVGLGGGHLHKIAAIDMSGIDPRVAKTEFIVACDVTNPLVGPNGASSVFGPQKGATPEIVETLDRNLSLYAEQIKNYLGISVATVPGAGAAGGLGAGLLAFTPAQLQKGIDIVIHFTELANKIIGADAVFTGEGGIDYQTKFGKTPYGVAQITKNVSPHTPVIALAGAIGDGVESLYDENFTAIFGILRQACSLEQALKEGERNIAFTTENIARLFALGIKNT
ncbi:glycerate kinase [Rosenbergiella collisarenosi]|uniref:glycerate kinase n=1 Tax=Rosenbergiella collisarenosi TaxID=1544695 RepID=UPI001BD9CD73|nr:glycerate kinase [Rosenbergiella collisarenosi]MBT0719925.1 glycerate kinase [Rosenbergiella collisarenosi]